MAKRELWQFAASDKSLQANVINRNLHRNQQSEKSKQLLADIERVSRRPYSILITGETGTGKTFAAREIHRLSVRSKKPFMELNCANLPEHLVEAELFGYRKGAFTGADRDHKGLFEEADGGILLLDEIGDVPPAVQNKLLKAIEEKQIKRLGTNHFIHCDVQIIAATSRNLCEMIAMGEFREDLYCRLAVLTIEVPPLRNRREDIPALIDFYLRETAQTVGTVTNQATAFCIEKGAVELLCEYDYPGNIRVLKNLIYELTSYISLDEPISIELVQISLAKLRQNIWSQIGVEGDLQIDKNKIVDTSPDRLISVQSITDEGDIVLPVEVCVIRRGETLKQWISRAKKCSIKAARNSTDGTLQNVAERLGITLNSLKGHLHRAEMTKRNTESR